jgi:hypothetical protein
MADGDDHGAIVGDEGREAMDGEGDAATTGDGARVGLDRTPVVWFSQRTLV